MEIRQRREDAQFSLVTFEDLLAEPSFAIKALYLPDSARLTPITWVHATEQVDPRPHLRRHELVCTLGSSLVEPGSAKLFVQAISQSGVAGVALGLGEVHLEGPQELITACEAAGVPLLAIPHGTPFLAVNDVLLRLRTKVESEARRTETALLAELLSLARHGTSAQELVDRAIAILGPGAEPPNHRSRAGSDLGDRRPSQPSPGLAEPSREFLEQFGSILEFTHVELERSRSDRLRRIGELIELVEAGLAHPAALLPELEHRDLAQAQLQVSAWPLGSESVLAARWPTAAIGVTEKYVAVIDCARAESDLETLGFVCGYSSLVELTGLRRGIGEARSALQLARTRGGIAGPDALATLPALLEQVPSSILDRFLDQWADPFF